MIDTEHTIELIQGLTRPVVTVVFTAVLSIGFLRGQVTGDAFLTVAVTAILFWFKDREAAKDAAANKAADKLVEKMTTPQPEVK